MTFHTRQFGSKILILALIVLLTFDRSDGQHTLPRQHLLPEQLGKSLRHHQGPAFADGQEHRVWLCGDEVDGQARLAIR